MRYLISALFVLCLASISLADTSNTLVLGPKGDRSTPHGGADGREGGETIADALLIESLPITDAGNTCDNLDDYDEACPYTGSTSPDVVYSYAPLSDESITIDLCSSSYDVKVFVYEDVVTPGAPFACNDDAGCGYSGYQSKLENLYIHTGHTYFIVIDGWSGDCGDYELSIAVNEPCIIECPDGALPEGEPPLVENYDDVYNGGCNSVPPILQTLIGNEDGHLVLCGRSGTYLFEGDNYRDTDWFTTRGRGAVMTCTITPEFPVNLFQLWVVPDCSVVYIIQEVSVPACESATIATWAGLGEEVMWWVGPTVFCGLPEFDYVLEFEGLDPLIVSVEQTTWGAIKNTYR